jgi:lipopolysaccharide export system ATP-binding protein
MNARAPFTVTEGLSGLRVEKLRKSYKRRPVIRDVTMELNRGEVVALLGPNGSGKTTSFYCIAGLITPDGGRVTIDGVRRDGLPDVPPRARRDRLPAAGDVDLPGSVGRGQHHGDSRGRRTQAVPPQGTAGGIAGRVFHRTPPPRARPVPVRRGTSPRGDRPLPRLQPPLRLLDEPFAGVDPIAVGDIRHLVSDLKTRGIGVLITDHNVRETLEIVDRAYILHDGTIIMSGTPTTWSGTKPCAGSTSARAFASPEALDHLQPRCRGPFALTGDTKLSPNVFDVRGCHIIDPFPERAFDQSGCGGRPGFSKTPRTGPGASAP